MQEKQKMKEIEKKQKIIDFENTKNDAETYKAEEAKRRDVIKQKNRVNQSQVLEQMKEEPRTFAKTGIAILQQ